MLEQRKTSYRKLLSITLLVLLQGLGLNLTSHISVIASRQQSGDLPAGRQEQSEVQANYASLPLAFEPNQGQVNSSAQFLVHHGQATTYFDGANTTTAVGDSRVTMSLDGANPPNFTGTDQLESRTNYFIGNDQSKWHSDVPNFKNLLAKNVYPGIDLKYYGTNSQLEHDFIVSPGTDYKQIAFHFDGQENLSLDADGNLIIRAGDNDLKLNAPTTYQQTHSPTGETKHTIPSNFELNDKTITIALNSDYDHSEPLIIDPVLSLLYSTYLGGTGTDVASRLVVDTSGNAYVSGNTNSTDFPVSSAYQGSNSGALDAFISKFSPDGQSLIYSTYLGGSADEDSNGIAVDSAGNIYVSGSTTSTDFPTSSPFQGANGGANDTYVTKLNASGAAIIYSTYLGGINNDILYDVLVDAAGSAYITGYTQSGDFPLQNPYQGSINNTMAFATKFAPDGQSLVYSTYLGGGGDSIDIAYCAALDSSGSLYLAGSTTTGGSGFPTVNAFQPSHGGSIWDMFVTKFAPDGQSLEYSTYLGGSSDEGGYIGCDIAVDSSESAYVVGTTGSTDFPTSSPYQASYAGGGYDGFLTKFAPNGMTVEYSTYLGGTGSDYITGVSVDSSDNAYITGNTYSNDFPTVSPYQASLTGLANIFITKFNANASALTYSTYLGSTSVDTSSAIALDVNGDVYVVGYTDSGDFPLHNPVQGSFAGGNADAFLVQLTLNSVVVTGQIAPTLQFSIGSTTCNMGFFSATQTQYCTHAMSAGSNASSGYVISYIPTTTLTSGANTIDAMVIQSASALDAEQFGLNLKSNTSAGSFTAANFGADESGGSGTAMTGYEISDQFKFTTGGDNIAQTTGAGLTTTYTASFITNITTTSEAGTYSTPVTYNIVASY